MHLGYFFLIFWPFCHQKQRSSLIWMFLGTLNTVPKHHFYFFLISWVCLGQLPYLEVCPGPYPLSSPTVSTNPKYSLMFSLFYCYCHVNKHELLYLEMHPRPWKCYATLSPIVSTIHQFFLIFQLFHCHFSFRWAWITIFRNAPCTLKMLPLVVTNSEYHPPIFTEFSAILLLFFI